MPSHLAAMDTAKGSNPNRLKAYRAVARPGPSHPDSGRIRLVVTVKAYPAISKSLGEVVCIAGIRTDTAIPKWVRLWPVEFRDLPFSLRFKKYQEISLKATRSRKDQRPESMRAVTETLELGRTLTTANGWAARRLWVEPLIVDSMCEVLRMQERDGTSLAVVRPGVVEDFLIEKDDTEWKQTQQAAMNQLSLFATAKKELKKIPYKFKYRYTCQRKGCGGHEQSVIDWELAQAYLTWPGSEKERLAKIRTKWLDEICGSDKETMFFVGNVHLHPRSFLVLGAFWPPKAQPSDQLAFTLGS